MKAIKQLLLMMMICAPLMACDTNDGAAEKMGESMDNAAEKVGDGMEDACEEVSGEDC